MRSVKETLNKSPTVRAEPVEAQCWRGLHFDKPVLSEDEGLSANGLVQYFLNSTGEPVFSGSQGNADFVIQ
ncbi:protein of unknown function [Denitratisoma oestradiolicum]|uniref:Uncharacterized protein n=1 Tax=Denitratisoma oestradiolicum TaxID=311182 RepID=A0A6S6Y0E5_9PROT|nr:protein of unknown function [Denitratisoma oestradiolicum]